MQHTQEPTAKNFPTLTYDNGNVFKMCHITAAAVQRIDNCVCMRVVPWYSFVLLQLFVNYFPIFLVEVCRWKIVGRFHHFHHHHHHWRYHRTIMSAMNSASSSSTHITEKLQQRHSNYINVAHFNLIIYTSPDDITQWISVAPFVRQS